MNLLNLKYKTQKGLIPMYIGTKPLQPF